jgi:DNA-binding CsgD family transcriptional regulator
MTSKEVTALSEYMPAISRLDKDKQSRFVLAVSELKAWRVSGFSLRKIDNKGMGTTISNHFPWKMEEGNKECQQEEIEHFSKELPYLKKENLNLITRSSDKLGSDFLHRMQRCGINNSVINVDFSNKQEINMAYLVCEPDKPEQRDALLNNQQFLQQIVGHLMPVIDSISLERGFKAKKRKLLTDDALNELFSLHSNTPTKSHKKLQVFLNGMTATLTACECKCLYYLGLELSSNVIGQRLLIRSSTVRTHINSIKDKLYIEDTEDLSVISREFFSNYHNIQECFYAI